MDFEDEVASSKRRGNFVKWVVCVVASLSLVIVSMLPLASKDGYMAKNQVMHLSILVEIGAVVVLFRLLMWNAKQEEAFK